MKLNKKQKAEIMCYVIDFGLWDYFDSCKWNEKAHKYRYVSAQEDRIYYFTQKSLADYFDNDLKEEDREQFIKDYLEREETK